MNGARSTYVFSKRFAFLPSKVKMYYFAHLITKQWNRLINLDIHFLTITTSQMRHPVCGCGGKCQFHMLITYSFRHFSPRKIELITYPLPARHLVFFLSGPQISAIISAVYRHYRTTENIQQPRNPWEQQDLSNKRALHIWAGNSLATVFI